MIPQIAPNRKRFAEKNAQTGASVPKVWYSNNVFLNFRLRASGKDVLGITKGDKENSYIVHFSDSAMVSRAVARGYVTVNGKEVELTEDTKQQLLKTDKEASAAREKAYQDWLIVSRNSILP